MIFIGGTGRSGTTILAQMFQADPRFAVFIEPRFLIDPGGLLDYLLTKSVTQGEFVENVATRFLPKLVDNLERFEVFPDAATVFTPEFVLEVAGEAGRVAGNATEFGRRFTVGLLGSIHDHLGTTYLVEKTPHTIVWAGDLAQVFGAAWFLHIIRDPRDICASVTPLKWGPQRFIDFPKWYNDLMARAWQQADRVTQRRYIVVNLDTMVEDPAGTFTHLCNTMRLGEPEPSTLDAIRELCTVEGSSRGRYKHDLTKDEARRVLDQTWEWHRKWLDRSIA